MAIKIQIVAEDKATPVINKALDAPKKKATETALGIKKGFADAFENVTQNATGAFGSVAGGLFKIPGPAGIAAASILAISGAFFTMAKRAAEANAASDTGAAKFLATLDKLSKGFFDLVDTVGSAVIPVFNALAEILGVAATEQETLALQTRKQQEAMIASVKGTDAFIQKLNEFLDASQRLLQTQIIQDYFKAFADGNTQLAKAYSDQLTRLGILQAKVKAVATEQKNSDADARKRFEENKKRFEENLKLEESARKLTRAAEEAQSKLLAEVVLNDRARRREAIAAEGEAAIAAARKEVQAYEQAKIERLKQLEEIRVKNEQIGAQILTSVSGSLAAAVIQGENLKKVLDNIIKQLATRLLAKLIFSGIGAILGGPVGLGAIGRLFGGFQHGGSFTVGGSGGIDQTLVAFRATRGERVTVTPANHTTNNVTNNSSTPVNVSINVNANNFDRNFVLSELVPMLNREVKNGLDLYASKIK